MTPKTAQEAEVAARQICAEFNIKLTEDDVFVKRDRAIIYWGGRGQTAEQSEAIRAKFQAAGFAIRPTSATWFENR